MLELKHIYKKFQDRVILDDISIQFPDTGFIGIQGSSGCGKSTLLYIIGLLDSDYQGEIFYNHEKIENREIFVRNNISYMMQNKDVIASLHVRENIELACMVSEIAYSRNDLKKIVIQLGIEQLMNSFPSQLSGGQLKRVSIAKALLKRSPIILCDEPTGALHVDQAQEVMELLKKISQDSLVIIVSHDVGLLKEYCDSILTLKNGQLKGKMKKSHQQIDQVKKHRYIPLWIYPIRQLLYQRNKLMFLFLFQWIVIVAFFLIVTVMNGVFDEIHQSEIHSVKANIMSVEKKDGTLFQELINNEHIADVHYGTNLEQVVLKSQDKELACTLEYLPMQQDHIQLSQGRMPRSGNEMIVSMALYRTLENKENIHFIYQDKNIEMVIVGVLEDNLFSTQEAYCLLSINDQFAEFNDKRSLLVEAKNNHSRELYQSLSNHYIVFSDVIERVDNYQSILSLAKMIAYVFVGVSFIISLILIAIVESIIYLERQHDVAYLLSLGLSKRRLFLLSFVEASLMGIVMASGGCLLSVVVYYYMNNVYQLYTHFHIQLVLKKIIFHRYDIFGVIILSYMLMTMIGSLLPMQRMMKTNMIDVLREE